MEKLFIKAAKSKVRFETVRGHVVVEDLFDMPLISKSGFSLDDLAKDLNKKVKDSEDESFVSERSTKNTELELKFEIVKYVISVRLEENKAKLEAKAKADQRQKILGLIDKKKDESLEGLSIEELEAKLSE